VNHEELKRIIVTGLTPTNQGTIGTRSRNTNRVKRKNLTLLIISKIFLFRFIRYLKRKLTKVELLLLDKLIEN